MNFKRVKCKTCHSTIEYDSTSIVEGNRDFEEIYCPKCKTVVARVYTDLSPIGYIVD